jgi:hypothetical protein
VTRLVHVIVEEGVANADDAAIRSGLWSQASQLTDLLLDAFKTHADSVENPVTLGQIRQDVAAERSALLELFLRQGEMERAAVLAEKYVDFNALLTVCDRQSSNPQSADAKLNEYIDKLGDSGFTEFACKWCGIEIFPTENVPKLTEFYSAGTCSGISAKNCCASVVRK